MKYNKFNTYREDSIDWLTYTNLIYFLQRTICDKIVDVLISVYMTDNEMMEMSYKVTTSDRKVITELKILVFYIHDKTIGNGKELTESRRTRLI